MSKKQDQNILELTIIDMEDKKEKIVNEVKQALIEVGFLLIKNIKGLNEDHWLSVIKKLHSVPQKIKDKMYLQHFRESNKNTYRGLMPLVDNDISHKEIFDMGRREDWLSEKMKGSILYDETPFPSDFEEECKEEGLDMQEIVEIQRDYMKQYELMHGLGMKLLGFIALALGKDENYFDPWFSQDCLSTLRSIYYPTRKWNQAQQDQLNSHQLSFTTPEHTDSGFITILTTFGFPGLQVLHQGVYKDVSTIHNGLVVNLGDMFARITNNQLQATKHRVIDIGVVRYSSPFFLDPSFNSIIPANILSSNRQQVDFQSQPADHDPIVFGKWVITKIVQTYGEWKNSKLAKFI